MRSDLFVPQWDQISKRFPEKLNWNQALRVQIHYRRKLRPSSVHRWGCVCGLLSFHLSSAMSGGVNVQWISTMNLCNEYHLLKAGKRPGDLFSIGWLDNCMNAQSYPIKWLVNGIIISLSCRNRLPQSSYMAAGHFNLHTKIAIPGIFRFSKLYWNYLHWHRPVFFLNTETPQMAYSLKQSTQDVLLFISEIYNPLYVSEAARAHTRAHTHEIKD